MGGCMGSRSLWMNLVKSEYESWENIRNKVVTNYFWMANFRIQGSFSGDCRTHIQAFNQLQEHSYFNIWLDGNAGNFLIWSNISIF